MNDRRILHRSPTVVSSSLRRSLLLSIARRVPADHIRLAQRSPRTLALDGREADVEATQHRGRSSFEGTVLLRQLLDQLTPPRREAFVATQVSGLTYAEALICDCPVGTIRPRVTRAREDLVAALREHHGPRTQTAN